MQGRVRSGERDVVGGADRRRWEGENIFNSMIDKCLISELNDDAGEREMGGWKMIILKLIDGARER